ncbi:MAG: GDP-mannose 4,6-dehydratase [Candidatus Pacebacteria bacterium]|nr:GDP-mannose 4,6-dehydratase [Candidatus Paceibacterota bacterium]
MSKRALITGITGQDGSYLAEFLLEREYEVFGLERRNSQKNRQNIEHILDSIELVSGDLSDQGSIILALNEVVPDEVYNLASQSFVHESWKQPIFTADVTGLGAARVLEAIRQIDPKIKFYQASSSEMFGKVQEMPQREKTMFYPRSPYGAAKLYAHWMTVNYRESYGMFAASGILFNHESPRRGLEFVMRKITNAAARIKLGMAKELRLGNLDAKRDWGFSGDYVKAMWMMLQQEKPDDFVIATGEEHSVREFVEEAFGCLDLDYEKYVVIDQKFVRPAEVDILKGDASKARNILKWEPKVTFRELVQMMVESDMKILQGSTARV